MPRFFIEVSYKGTKYGGFQRQDNTITIQSEIENALKVYFRHPFMLTGSSRTDAGVHARQNFFHFDSDSIELQPDYKGVVYHLNAILPQDIAVNGLFAVKADAHCRFDALSRSYQYTIYRQKNPFLQEVAYYYPYLLDEHILVDCAKQFPLHTYYEAFSKKNVQVFTYNCEILESEWVISADRLIFNVTANRFLRGMVKGMVGTMLKAATKKHSSQSIADIIASGNPSRVNFAVPSHGLCLVKVSYAAGIELHASPY
jgi:tRNA pseudouridine38-40 synthase